MSIRYEKLELPGALLVDGFSIYLIEVRYEGTSYYYIGMTGDGYYRSARAGFYRLAGHLEYQNKRSTQNQLLGGLMRIMKTTSRRELNRKIDNARITFHHFPIEGFVPDEARKLAREDNHYRIQRQRVVKLEAALIYHLRNKLNGRLLNQTVGEEVDQVPYPEIFKRISDIAANE